MTELEAEGFTAPTESVTIVLSAERYNELTESLATLAGIHHDHGDSDAAEAVADLLDLIDTKWSTFK